MAQSTTSTYPFDPSGKAASNAVTNDIQSLQFDGNKTFLIPVAAPFFKDGMRVYNPQSGTVYQEGVDFEFGHLFTEAVEAIGRPIYGSVVFINQSISKVVAFDYQTIGGVWGCSEKGLTQELINKLINPITRTWGQIEGLPYAFPPIDHDENIGVFVGTDKIYEALRAVADAISVSSEGVTSGHLVDYNNPHRTNAAQVGLGNVDNYPTATEKQATDGVSNESFMTPLRTAQAINLLAVEVINKHAANKRNPHETTAEQVGLGNVSNYKTASIEEAVAGIAENLFVTPAGLKAAINKLSQASYLEGIETDIDDHKKNKENPHDTTAEQVGTYTKQQIDDRIKNIQATNTAKFADRTEQEWRASLPTIDGVTDLHTKIATLFESKVVELEALDIVDGSITNEMKASSVVGGYDNYAVVTDTGDVVTVGASMVDETRLKRHLFFFGNNATYLVNANGLIYASGSSSLTPPEEYRAGSETPTNPATRVVGNAGVAYALLKDGSVLTWNSTTYSKLSTTTVVDIATSLGETDHTVLLKGDGSLVAVGNDKWVAAIQPLFKQAPRIGKVAVGDKYTFALTTAGKIMGWSTRTATDGSVVASAITLDDDVSKAVYTDVAGVMNDFIFLTNTGDIKGYGDNNNGQLNFNQHVNKVVSVGAGYDFLLSIDENWGVIVWGNVSSALNAPALNGNG